MKVGSDAFKKFLRSPVKRGRSVYLGIETLTIPFFGIPYGLFLAYQGVTILLDDFIVPASLALGFSALILLLTGLSIVRGPQKGIRYVFLMLLFTSHVLGISLGYLPIYTLAFILVMLVLGFQLLGRGGYIFLYFLLIVYNLVIHFFVYFYTFYSHSFLQNLWYILIYGILAIIYWLFHYRIDHEVGESLRKGTLLEEVYERKKLESEKKAELRADLEKKQDELERVNQELVKRSLDKRG